jgi:prevent-host-death family protein
MDVLKKITALKARQNLGQVLEEVYYKGDRYIIERAGKPMAAVVPLWQLEAWQQRRAQFFGTVEEVWEQNKDISPDVIEQEVTEAVNAVRTPRSASSPQ